MFIQLLFLLSSFHQIVYGRHNVTIDDQNPLITYSPAASWNLSAPNGLDAGGAHTLTADSTATANFTFTGVAIYFMSPLWPYLVNTAISLDSAPLVLIDLVDHSRPDVGMGPETVQSQVVWGEAALGNRQHSLVISVGANQPYAIVDTLIYTALDPEDLTTTTSTSTTTSNSTSPTATTTSEPASDPSFGAPSRTRVLPIALGTVLGVLGLLIVVLAIWFFRRRQRRPVSEAWTVAGHSYSGSSHMTSAMSSPRGTVRLASDDSVHANNAAYHPANGGGFPQYGNIYNSSIPVPPAGVWLASQPRSSNNSGTQGYNPWGPMPSATSPQSPHRSIATAYQSSRLSTITETSTPQAGGGSSLANSPASQETDIYHDAEDGSDRRSSLPGISESQSRASPYLSQQRHLRRDPRDIAARSQLGASSPGGIVDGPPNRYRPPAYTADP